MAVIEQVSLPKGKIGMTLVGSSNDDNTVTLPDIGFNFNYNGLVIRQLYVSGNTWIGLGSAIEHICINRRDTSYNNLYYSNEIEYNTKLFRIRFEGNSTYNSWGSNNLIWEFSIFETGIMRLVLEKIPNNGTNSFNNPGIGAQSLILEEGKSYIFIPQDSLGKNYTIQKGSYIPSIIKFLMIDSEGIKSYQNGSWNKVGELPITEEVFKTYGVDIIPASMSGLIGNSPALYIYTDNPEVKENRNSYRFFIEKKVTSKAKIIIQNYDFDIHEAKIINKLEAVMQYTKKDSSLNDVVTNGSIKIALSVDLGESWLTYNINTSNFEIININNVNEFIDNGINPSILTSIDYEALNNLIKERRKLRFAYILDKPTLNDVCKLRKIKILYS